MTVYISHPMSNLSFEEVMQYYLEVIWRLKEKCPDVKILYPLIGKGSLANEEKLNANGYDDNPVSNKHAIYKRDRWMVQQSDIVIVDLTDGDGVSIGCLFELAWADLLGKYTVVVKREDDMKYKHAFIDEAADAIFDNIYDAIDYIQKLETAKIF